MNQVYCTDCARPLALGELLIDDFPYFIEEPLGEIKEIKVLACPLCESSANLEPHDPETSDDQ